MIKSKFQNWLSLLIALVTLCATLELAAEGVGCAIEPNRTVQLSTAVEGVLDDVKVKRGDVVKAGEVVALLQAGVERAAVKLAQKRATLQAQIDARLARVKSAERKLRRAEDLVDKNFVSSEELEDAATELEVAERNLQEALESQQLAKLDLVRAKEQLALRVIKSPIDGVVVQTFLSGGEFAQGQPILEIAAIDPLHVEVILPMSEYGEIDVGSKAMVSPEAPLTGEHEAAVTIVDKVVDAASGTFGVRLLLPNAEFQLPAGIECEVSFSP
ncbi:MAG: efflux RND transporter periplasmic adaptor subunit [Gammaproteobacteria bacterium]